MNAITEITNTFDQVARIDLFDEPTTVNNGWFGEIENCIAYIEILGQRDADAVYYALKSEGYKVDKIGLDLYIKVK
jgi:hypothetical protein